MLTVSNELKNAFMKDERTIYVRIKIGNRTFDNDNVISVDYDAGSLSGEVFAIGSTYSNSIKITFSELVEGLKELDEVTYEIGIKLPNGTIEYVPMGVFVINDAIEMDRNNNKTTIECMDRMVMMGGAYVSSLNYPASIREVALEIANKAGIQVANTFDRLSSDVIAKPEGYTYREAIGLIAQFEAGFATFNRYGKLEIRTLSDPNFAIPPDNYFSKGLVKNEVFFRLGGISCTNDDSDTVIQSGNTAGNQVVLENRVMTKFLLDKIYQKIQTINYYPFSLSWQGNPVLEAGDWIEVEDLQGNKFKTPNLSYSLSFNGGLSAKSSAETVTQSNATYQYKSPLQQKIEWIHARIDAAGGNVVYEGIDEPVNPKEGDLWFKIIGPDKEILIYKKDKDGNLFWDPQISTADIDKVAKEVEEAIEQIEEVEKSANSAVEKADQAIEEAGFAKVDATSAKASALDAVNTANTAKTNAGTALTTAQTSLTSSVDALAKAGQALAKATATEITTGSLTTSYDALTKTVALKADNTELNIVKGTVTQHGLDISANATAVGLKADKTLVNTIKGTVDKHTLDIKAGADGLLLKADSSLVNTLKGTVDSQGLAITAASNGLTLKADTSVVNTIKGTVDTHTNQIKVVSDGMALKAESSLVNTINGTVNTHTNQIAANSTAISARLTSAQVDSLVTGKGYATTTALNATSSSLSASIVEVSTDLSNLEIGGRNLWNGSFGKEIKDYLPMYQIGGTKTIMQDASLPSKNFMRISNYTAVGGNSDSFYISGNNNNLSENLIGEMVTISLYVRSNVSYVIDGITIQNYWTKVVLPAMTLSATNRHFYFRGVGQTTLDISSIKVEKGNTATDWSPAPEDMATVERAVQIEANLNGLLTTVKNKAEQSQVTQLAGQISTKVENATYNSKMTQLDNAINLRVSKANIVTEINLSAETSTVRIAGKRIQLDGDVAMDNAFVNRIKAIEVIADKITSGNLNAANVNIINLNASKITTGILSGIEIASTFDYIYEGTTRNVGTTTIKNGTISSYGSFTNNFGGTYMYINPDTIYAQNMQANGNVRSMFKLSGIGLEVNVLGVMASYTQDGIYFQSGGTASINYRTSNARIEVGSYNGVDLGTKVNGVYQSKFAVGGGKDGITSFVDAYAPFTARQGIDAYAQEIKNAITISGTNNIFFRSSSNRIVQGSDGFLNILSPMQLSLGWTNGSSSFTTMIITQNQIVAKKNLNMDGNQMVGVSDSRLKTAINSTVIDSLSAISRWKFVDFNWRYDDKPKGRQFGLIAQDTPELALYDDKNDEYTISASKQIMMTSHGLSQLNNKVVGITALIYSSNATANKALFEIQILRKEIQDLRQKIDKLESAA